MQDACTLSPTHLTRHGGRQAAVNKSSHNVLCGAVSGEDPTHSSATSVPENSTRRRRHRLAAVRPLATSHRRITRPHTPCPRQIPPVFPTSSRHESLIRPTASLAPNPARAPSAPMAADASDDLARRLAAFLPPPPQKQQLSVVAAAVLDAGGRLGRAVGDVFRRLRIDDGFYPDAPRRRRNAGDRSGAAGSASDAHGKEGIAGGPDPIAASGRLARSQGSMSLSATYDSRRNDVESAVVARGELWRAEATHSSAAAAPLFLVQLGPVLFVRDTTLLFPVHLSKRHLIWYGFERKNGVHSVCPAYWSARRRWFFMSMICLSPFACSFMDVQFPNGQVRYVAGDGLAARAFLPLCRGIFQAHGKFPGEKRLSFSFKNRRGGSVTPMVQWPDKSFSLGIVQALSWKRCGLMLQPALQLSVCPTFGGSRPGVSMELTHSVNENAGIACGYSHTAAPSAYASVSIGRSKLNDSAGLVFRVDAPLHSYGRPWFSIQMNSGLEF